jgi:hypothetical protein
MTRENQPVSKRAIERQWPRQIIPFWSADALQTGLAAAPEAGKRDGQDTGLVFCPCPVLLDYVEGENGQLAGRDTCPGTVPLSRLYSIARSKPAYSEVDELGRLADPLPKGNRRPPGESR